MTTIKGKADYGFIPAELHSLVFRQQYYEVTGTAISEHLQTLRRYAQSSDAVCELGVESGQSTTALLLGQPSQLFSFDLVERPELQQIIDAASFTKRCPDHLECRIGKTYWILTTPFDTSKLAVPACDLLFIDTWHCAPQLKKELNLNHDRVRKWIIMHDTVSFGEKGEGWQDWEAAHLTDGPLLGLTSAINAFLYDHPEWVVKEHYPNNNGLTILGRKL